MFQKGVSGNPGGRPKASQTIMELARKHCPRAIERLAEIMETGTERAAVAAAQALLDRGFGKPAQQMEVVGVEGGSLGVVLNVIKSGSQSPSSSETELSS